MRKLIIILALLCAGQAWGATYYIDKRCANEGDGSASSCAATTNGVGAFKSITRANNTTYVPAGADHTIVIVAGSGPYYPSDAMILNTGYIYPLQNNAANTITWNFNKEAFEADFNVNSSAFSWVQSEAAGKTTWYYLQASGGGQPQIPATHNCCSTCSGGGAGCAAAALPQIYQVTIGDHIWGDWNDDSSNLTSGAASYKANNWAWGDYDTLGYNTLYVHLSGDANPTDTGVGVWVGTRTYAVRLTENYSANTFNDGVFSGATGTGIINARGKVVLNRCTVVNANDEGLALNHVGASGSAAYFTRFVNAGHQANYIGVQADFTAVNNYYKYNHLALYIASDTAHTITFKNNICHEAYAGCIKKDVATPTLFETNNIFHIDPDSTHGGKAISFTSTSRQWETTDDSDFPASTATTDTDGIDPLVNAYGRPVAGSPAIDAGTAVTGLHTSGSKLITGGDAAGNTKLYGNGIDIGAYERKKFLFDDDDMIPLYYTYIAAGAGDTWQSEAMTWQGESVTW